MSAAKWNGLIHTIGFVGGSDGSLAQYVGKSISKAIIVRGVLIGSVEE